VWYLGYFLREAAVTFGQERRLHAIAVAMIGVALMILGLFLLVVCNTRLLLHDLGAQFKFVIFLVDHIQSEQRQDIELQLWASPGTQAVHYVSKEQAWQELTAWLPEGTHLLDGLTHNPLPASYVVSLTPQAQQSMAVQTLAQHLSRLPGVEEVEYGAKWHQGFQTVLHVGQLFSVAGGLLLSLGVMCIIANTIRLTIYTRVHEIEIMQLVGATEGFIKGPFLISGMVQGLLGACLALGLLLGVYELLVHHLGSILTLTFGLRQLVFLPWFLVAALLISGIGLGYIGSAFSLNRVLRALHTAH
jgi:cell division transport system permease protein